MQGYDFHGTWEAVTNQQSALRVPKGAPDDPDFSVEVAIDGWIARGAPRHKLVLGIPYYGQGWTGVTGGGNRLFQPATGPAPATHAAGFEDYKQLKNLARDGFTVHRDLRAGHAWLFDGTTFWTYDDPVVVLQKTLYIRRAGLGRGDDLVTRRRRRSRRTPRAWPAGMRGWPPRRAWRGRTTRLSRPVA